MAEDSANRTHQRLEWPPNGFEDRPEHQSRLPSVSHCSGKGRRARNGRGRGTEGTEGTEGDVAAKGGRRVHWKGYRFD